MTIYRKKSIFIFSNFMKYKYIIPHIPHTINHNHIIIIVFILFFYVLFYALEFYEYCDKSIQTRTLENDGFCVLYNHLYAKKTTGLPCDELEHDILQNLPPDYVFVDYVYTIKDVALSTFHRDVTSSQCNYHTKYPVYTAILYKYNGELLSVCPSSNYDYPLCWSHIVNISGEKGTVFVFDSNLLHAGQINNCQYREVIQYKLCHKDDIDKLTHLDGVRAEKTDVCSLSVYNLLMRKLSYYFECPINSFFYPLMIKRENTNTIIGAIQSIIPLTYYNNV